MSESTEVAVAQPTAIAIPSRSERAAALATRVRPVSNMIKIAENGTGFSIPGLGDTEGPIDIVILEFIAKNVYYDPNKPWKQGEANPPLCAAMDFKSNDDLIPFENARELQVELTNEDGERVGCRECPMDQFGSGTTGKNKACQNRKIVAVLPPDATAETEVLLVDVSSMGAQTFDKVISQMTGPMGIEPHYGIAELKPIKAGRAQSIGFAKARRGEFSPEQIAIFESKLDEAAHMLAVPVRFE